MAEYRTVEGPITTIDTLTELTTFVDETAAGPVKVPDNRRKLVEIWASVAIEIEDSEIQSYVLRLSGKGMKDGEQDFGLGAGSANGTIADVQNIQSRIYPVDVALTPNESITVKVGVGGSALAADGQATITLVFA